MRTCVCLLRYVVSVQVDGTYMYLAAWIYKDLLCSCYFRILGHAGDMNLDTYIYTMMRFIFFGRSSLRIILINNSLCLKRVRVVYIRREKGRRNILIIVLSRNFPRLKQNIDNNNLWIISSYIKNSLLAILIHVNNNAHILTKIRESFSKFKSIDILHQSAPILRKAKKWWSISLSDTDRQEASRALFPFEAHNSVYESVENPGLFHGAFGTINGIYIPILSRKRMLVIRRASRQIPQKQKLQCSMSTSSIDHFIEGISRMGIPRCRWSLSRNWRNMSLSAKNSAIVPQNIFR